VRWLLAHATTDNVIRLRLRAVPDRDDVAASLMPQVVGAVAAGFTQIQQTATRPPFFNDTALERVADLSDLAHDLGQMRVVNGTIGTDLTQSAANNVRSLLGPSYSSIGSVEGWLQAVNLHERHTFHVYDTLHNRRIRCEFGDRIPVPRVAEALGRGSRVTVYGTVRYRSDDEVESVLADELVEFPDDADLPSAYDVRGILD
jgi:hypothetical protein